MKNWAAHLSALISRLFKVMEFCSSATLLGVMLLIMVDVIGRYFFSSPLNGATELTEMSIAVIVFLMFPIIGYFEQHIAIDIMDSFVPRKFAVLRDIITKFLMGSSLIVVAYYIITLGQRSQRREGVSEYLRLPLYPLFYLIAVMCILSGLLIILKIFPILNIKQEKLLHTEM